MLHAYTGTAVLAAEQPLLQAGQGDALMRTAAWGLSVHVLRELRRRGGVAGSTAAALVGTGNNGGDALWALSFLRHRGVHAVAVPVGERMHTPGRQALLRAGGRIQDTVPQDSAVVIDGVLGTGARGAWEPDHDVSVPHGATVIACDVPSGVNADTGEVLGHVIPADLTVTFGAVKAGPLIGAGAHAAGRVETVDIGLGPHLGDPEASSVEAAEARSVFSPPQWDVHKYRRGVVGVAAGSEQYPGAASLVCSAALASGVGMVQLTAPPTVRELVLTGHPEVVGQDRPGGKATAWVCGPGLGTGQEARERFDAVLEECRASALPLVLDASALELITTEHLQELAQAGVPVVLTPHLGELRKLIQRLAPEIGDEDVEKAGELLDSDPLTAARAVARHLGVILVFKGPSTLCAAPDGQVFIQTEGGPELATGGTGDCLAGLIGAALSRQGEHRTVERVAAAVWLHGTAGHTAAAGGPFGASELPGAVRTVLAGPRCENGDHHVR